MMEIKGNMMSVREDVRVLDATLRDGGLVNDFYFTDDFVYDLYKANLAAGVDYMEFGYRADKKQFDVNLDDYTISIRMPKGKNRKQWDRNKLKGKIGDILNEAFRNKGGFSGKEIYSIHLKALILGLSLIHISESTRP